MYKRLLLVILLMFTGCGLFASSSPSTTLTLPPSSMPTSIIPSPTFLSVPISNPTSTPTQILPVAFGTPIILLNGAITPENIDRLGELSYWGNGVPATNADVAWSPTGDLIAVPSALGIYLYDDTLELLDFVEIEAGIFTCVSFSPDGKYISIGSKDGVVLLIDIQSKSIIRSIVAHNKPVVAIKFSPNGDELFSGSDDGLVKSWNVDNGKLLFQIDNRDPISALDVSSDGELLLVGSITGNVKLYNSETGSQIRKFKRQSTSIGSIAFSPDNRFFVTANNAFELVWWELNVWKVDNGSLISTVRNEKVAYSDVVFSSDGKYIIAGKTYYGTGIGIWDSFSGKLLATIETDSAMSGIGLSPDGGKVVSLGADGDMHIWDLANRTLLYRSENIVPNIFTDLALSPDGRYLAIASWNDKVLPVYDIWGGKLFNKYDPKSYDYGVSFSPNGKYLLTTNTVGGYRYWEISRYQSTLGYNPSCDSVNFSNDGHWVAYEDISYGLQFMQFGDQQNPRKFDFFANCSSFSSDGKLLAAGGRNGVVKIWEVPTGTLIKNLRAHTDSVSQVVFSPNKKYLATLSIDETLRIWDIDNWNEVYSFQGVATGLAYSPDGTMIVAGTKSGDLMVWDAENSHLLKKIKAHRDRIIKIIYSLDQRFIVTASMDGTIKFWGIR